MGEIKFNFGGYATRNNIECSDGRTIKHNAFQEQDGITVPLVWQHQHNTPDNVLGHALLENREDGVYVYGKFNDSPAGKNARQLVEHKDINALSIYANNLRQNGSDVVHGVIREVSLVLAGANPGAFIDNIVLEHADGSNESPTEATIYFGEEDQSFELDPVVYLEHKDDDITIKELFDTFSGMQKEVLYTAVAHAAEGHTDEVKKIQTVLASALTDQQMGLANAIITEASNEAEETKEVKHTDQGDGDHMKNNIFDNNNKKDDAKRLVLTHSDLETLQERAINSKTSMREQVLAHAEAEGYGIENIDFLFPDAKTIAKEPTFIKRDTDWVAGVLAGVYKTPFSRIKTLAADITADEARAKGYVKATLKKEEIFKLLKRVTTPTTIYKKQKLDRDDIVDITDFDVVSWVKGEMRVMLNEEIARAILIGDGRDIADEDKINEENIRPIYKDNEMYTHRVLVDDATDVEKLIELIIRSRKLYKGRGTPTLYTTSDVLTDMLLAKDKVGRRLYPTVAELKAVLRVADIVEVEVMEGTTGTFEHGGEDTEVALKAIMVNLNDYALGADRGGEINLFDDFDIDYNQYKYLMETRASGALRDPKTALVFEATVPAVDPVPEG